MSTKKILLALAIGSVAAPAVAETYPVSGQWGVSASAEKGAIECHGRRVIGFKGEQRTDNKGGVPAYRNVSVHPQDATTFQVVDEFSNGQVNRGRVRYTLRLIDNDHVEMLLQPGGTLKLQRCK